VLPFDNFSDDKRNAYFADGIQDDILTALSKVSDLKVISRNSVMQYRDKARNTREIGQALGVAYLLEGSVRRANDKVRITAQLIDARNDRHVMAGAKLGNRRNFFGGPGEDDDVWQVLFQRVSVAFIDEQLLLADDNILSARDRDERGHYLGREAYRFRGLHLVNVKQCSGACRAVAAQLSFKGLIVRELMPKAFRAVWPPSNLNI